MRHWRSFVEITLEAAAAFVVLTSVKLGEFCAAAAAVACRRVEELDSRRSVQSSWTLPSSGDVVTCESWAVASGGGEECMLLCGGDGGGGPDFNRPVRRGGRRLLFGLVQLMADGCGGAGWG